MEFLNFVGQYTNEIDLAVKTVLASVITIGVGFGIKGALVNDK